MTVVEEIALGEVEAAVALAGGWGRAVTSGGDTFVEVVTVTLGRGVAVSVASTVGLGTAVGGGATVLVTSSMAVGESVGTPTATGASGVSGVPRRAPT